VATITYLAVGALEPKFWLELIARLGLPELAGTAFHGGPDAAGTTARLADAIAGKTRAEWMAIFADADACCEPVLTFRETREHPQWRARRSFVTLPTPNGGTLHVPKMPASLARFDTEERDL